MVQDTPNGESEQADLDEDIAMALVNQVIRPSEDPPEDDAQESEAPVGANPAAASGSQLQDPGWGEVAIARPDYGERNYVGHHRMMGMRTLITGGERSETVEASVQARGAAWAKALAASRAQPARARNGRRSVARRTGSEEASMRMAFQRAMDDI